jgi:hypothetical protein
VQVSGLIAPPFLGSALHVGELSASRSRRFTRRKEPPVRITEEAGRSPEPAYRLPKLGRAAIATPPLRRGPHSLVVESSGEMVN